MRENNYRARYYSLGDRVRNAYQSIAEQINALHNYASRLIQMYYNGPELILAGRNGRIYNTEVFRMPYVFMTRGRGKSTFQRTDKKLKGSGKNRSNRPKKRN